LDENAGKVSKWRIRVKAYIPTFPEHDPLDIQLKAIKFR
jgi:hypothetical protein